MPPLTSVKLACALSVVAAAAAAAQSTASSLSPAPRAAVAARKSLDATRLSGAAPTIDGRLDDPAWRAAPVASGFIQQRPTPGEAATERTEARILYDDHAIYVAMRMYRSDRARIASTIARRDYTGYSDWAQVMVDSYHDRRTAFRFAVNPSGVQKDVLEYDDGNGEDVGWDAVWESAARVDSLGWTAEFRIPLSQLRFSTRDADGAGAVWGIDFIRDDASKNERDYWAPIPPQGPGFVHWFGDLAGLRGLGAPSRLEVLPYTLGSDTHAPGSDADPFFHAHDFSGKVGTDLKYGLTSDLTLTAALNPDFGQVEADPSVVNLTAFETFFPEKRPLFLEGEQFFTFGVGFPYYVPGAGFSNDQPFYSRRIGRAPQGSVPDSALYSDAPEATTILGAAKISGRTASGWSLGVLDAVTGRESARYATADGTRLSTPVEPLTNYAVARGTKDFHDGGSAIGGIFTAADRSVGGGPLSWLRSGAYTAGVDGRHRFHHDDYEVSASVLASRIEGSAESITLLQRAPGHWFQRPDADYLHLDTARTSLSGLATSARFGKIGGNWHWGVAGLTRSPGFEMNDVGFQQSADWLVGGAQVGYLDFTPGRKVRDWNVFASASSGWTYGGERRATGIDVNGTIDWLNGSMLFLEFSQRLPALSVDALRGGPALRTPASTSLFLSASSDTRRRVYVTLDANGMREPETGGHDLWVNPMVDVRAGGRAEFSIGPYAERSVNPWQFVTTADALGAPHWLFGTIRQTTVSLTARASYSFTPTLSLQLYGEPFISAGKYHAFKEVTDPRASRFGDRFHTFGGSEIAYDAATGAYAVDVNGDGSSDLGFGNPDFNFKQFRSTTVLRWEYRPGSTLFVVWSDGRSRFDPTGDFALGDDAGRLFRAPATDVLLVKLNYWLNW
ncbi:MAG TPA: DUF5916 domain-containing protein [Gemmatimonadaceae bacterium]|nr:DUF5916 domain-containing protein [Gemmatimonadaceae bacterium]